jgi:flagellin
MTSINTNFAAMTALQTLTMTQKDMTDTQNRISTGLRVSSAKDNAAYWSIATTMKSDNSALSAVSDALGLGASTVGVATSALNTEITIAQQIKAKLVTASTPGVDRTKIQTEITQLQNQLKSTANSANFSGQNFLSVDLSANGGNGTRSIVASFSSSGGTVSIGTIDVDTTATQLIDADATHTAAGGNLTGILDKAGTALTGTLATGGAAGNGKFSVLDIDISTMTDSAADLTDLKSLISQVDTAVAGMTSAAANLGAISSRIDTQKSFVSALSTTIDQGISTLIDADMTAESTKLQALQTKQQLGVQALSIANQSTQSILSLFRGG